MHRFAAATILAILAGPAFAQAPPAAFGPAPEADPISVALQEELMSQIRETVSVRAQANAQAKEMRTQIDAANKRADEAEAKLKALKP